MSGMEVASGSRSHKKIVIHIYHSVIDSPYLARLILLYSVSSLCACSVSPLPLITQINKSLLVVVIISRDIIRSDIIIKSLL